MRPSGFEQVHRLVEPGGEARQLAVDLHADRLERAARRVATAPAGGGGDAALDRLDQVAGRRAAGGRRRSRPRCGGRSAPRRCAAMSAARSASEYSLTTVAAVSVCTLSMRMSSGAASAQYENPRTGRSSCGLLTPRSNKIATIPSFPTMSAFPRCRRLARSRPARCGPGPRRVRAPRPPLPRRRDPGRCRGDGGRGGRSGGARAWPPPPTVASTTSPVGTAARSSVTSAAITGGARSRRPSRPPLLAPPTRRPPPRPPPAPRTRRRKRSGRKGRLRRAARGAGGGPAGSPLSMCCSRVLAVSRQIPKSGRSSDSVSASAPMPVELEPALAVPDLDPGVEAHDHHLALEVGERAEVRRQRHPTLLVGLDLAGARRRTPERR